MSTKSCYDKFKLSGISEVYFWKSQWENFDPGDLGTKISCYYIIYRFLYMCWFVGSFTAFFVCGHEEDYLFYVYLTNQTYTLQVLYSVLYFSYICWKLWEKQNNGSDNYKDAYKTPLSFCSKTLWFLMNIVHVNPYPVSLTYWLLLEEPGKDFSTPCKAARNHLTHTVNSPTALIDSLIVSVPIRFSHLIYPALGACCYNLFAFVYERMHFPLPREKTAIYKVLDWNGDPVQAIYTGLGGVAAGIVCHILFCWGIYHLRLFLSRKCNVGQQQYSNSSVQAEEPEYSIDSYSRNTNRLERFERTNDRANRLERFEGINDKANRLNRFERTNDTSNRLERFEGTNDSGYMEVSIDIQVQL